MPLLFETSIYPEVKQWLSENSEDKRLPEATKQNLLCFKNLTESEKKCLQTALLAITELPDVIRKFIPDRLSEFGDPLAEVSKYLTAQSIQNLTWTSRSMHATFHGFKLNAKFLECVAYGQQDKAEKLLSHVFQGNPEKIQAALLYQGTFTDYSGRTFNCSAYEYAYWAKDTHMCRMLESYMDEETKAHMLVRIDAIEASGLSYQQNDVKHCSAHFDLTTLRGALRTFANGYDVWNESSNWEAIKNAWMNVGKAQRDVPAHIAQEYCRQDRSFYPCPSFDELTLPRGLTFYNGVTSQDVVSWFPLTASNSGLGFDFGVRRGELEEMARATLRGRGPMLADRDLKAIIRLDEVRTADLAQSREHLNPPVMSHSHGLSR